MNDVYGVYRRYPTRKGVQELRGGVGIKLRDAPHKFSQVATIDKFFGKVASSFHFDVVEGSGNIGVADLSAQVRASIKTSFSIVILRPL